MAQSAEYSDLRWVAPRAYGKGRDGKAVRYIVIHYTAGAERSTSAEDGAAYDARRTDGTSTHYFVDSNSVVQCVRTSDRANAARAKGNRLGIQYELCGTAQTRAQWLDAASLPTLKNAARQVARDCKKYGIPVKRLSVAETRAAWTQYPNGPKGIVGHVDCTNAYPEDGGDHTDPGPAFPWDVFLDMVRDEMEDDDMPTPEQYAEAVWAHRFTDPASTSKPPRTVAAGTIQAYRDSVSVGQADRVIKDTAARIGPLEQKVDQLTKLVSDLITVVNTKP
jgi:N-acetyl-anhydromuramyl-L-alanine amidase AmpD